jgi:hypothetical protein|tara:strand:+ start:1365 stop:1619 length:255 start_codon:yes stop_codon:yes gene_type:complete
MALNPPAWAKNAVASPAGWRDVRTGELLKAQKMTAQQVAEANGVVAKPAKAKPKPKPAMMTESPTTEEEYIDEMWDGEDEDSKD